ncbi:MAG: hypothetical protein ACLFWI_25815 [Coleofasciculus sp.]|uniref:hypothetical protein n=1 Tax=Coleofasciculus sp. TaxID=3100458 RepID=UPI003A37A0E7
MISKKRIAKFLELLHQQSSIFADCSQETWAELDQKLAQFGDEDYEEIEDAILDWLDDHDYDAIKVALQTIKKDPLGDNETPPPPPESEQPITNTALRSAIKDAQSQHQQQSQSSK